LEGYGRLVVLSFVHEAQRDVTSIVQPLFVHHYVWAKINIKVYNQRVVCCLFSNFAPNYNSIGFNFDKVEKVILVT